MSRINDLLRQLRAKDPALADDLEREVTALQDRRAFGLNFERHVPEVVGLPGRPVRKGDKVRVLPSRGETSNADNDRLWRVLVIDRSPNARTASLQMLSRAEDDSFPETTADLDDLVVVAEFRDPIYPGLVSAGRIERGRDKPFHTVINAENYHALQTLLFTHRSQVDCIYIDPPYNTGNEGWIYNDKYVADDDHYKHSKWLAFMERRLQLAKELLKPTGVIIVAIGDEEHHRLRMLMDQVFDKLNYIGSVVWQGGVKNDARFLGGGLDYMLVYAQDRDTLAKSGARWREAKADFQALLDAGERIWQEALGDHGTAVKLLAAWRAENKGILAASVIEKARIDADGSLFKATDLSWPGAGGPRFDILHPITGQPVAVPKRGWGISEPQMKQLIAEGRIIFGSDHTSSARLKTPIDQTDTEVAKPTFYLDRRTSAQRLEKVFGDKRFPFPKDHEVLMRWLRLVANHDALILDFYAGSGSTAEAAMRLNEEDGGTRRCILVTNNEVAAADAKGLRKAGHRPGDPEWEAKGVFEYVTKSRISTVATGVREDGSTYSKGLEQNVEFFDLTYEAPLRVSSNREFAKIAPLLWMRAGSRGRRIEDVSAGWEVADTYGVLADLDHTGEFARAVAANEDVSIAYVVTDESRLFEAVSQQLPDHVEPVRLYEAYLRNFEIESGRGAR